MSEILTASDDASKQVLDPKTYLIRVLLAGPSGGGKTQGMMSLPGRKLLIDLDNRAESVYGTKNLHIIKCHEADPKSPKAWDRLLKIQKSILSDIKADDFPFESVIYDGLTMMGRIAMNWALMLDNKRGLGGSPAKQHYGPQMDNLSKFMISSLQIPRNVGYSAHMEMFEDKKAATLDFLPKITGKLRTEIAGWFSECYYVYRTPDDEGNRSYRWLTAGDRKYEFFKSSLNSLGDYWEDPVEIPKDGYADQSNGFMQLLKWRFENVKDSKGSDTKHSK